MHIDTVISYFVIWTSLSPLSYCNGSQRTQNKQTAAAGITTQIIFTIPETPEISMKPQTATCQSGIMASYKIGLLTIYGKKKYKEKITCKKFYCIST
jgi:hypothetical protein